MSLELRFRIPPPPFAEATSVTEWLRSRRDPFFENPLAHGMQPGDGKKVLVIPGLVATDHFMQHTMGKVLEKADYRPIPAGILINDASADANMGSIVDQLDQEEGPVSIVAHSLGALYACSAAIRCPNVSEIVLIAEASRHPKLHLTQPYNWMIAAAIPHVRPSMRRIIEEIDENPPRVPVTHIIPTHDPVVLDFPQEEGAGTNERFVYVKAAHGGVLFKRETYIAIGDAVSPNSTRIAV